MASMQCQKPAAAQTSNHVQTSANSHRKENDHSFTNRVKEMANSAYKKMTEHMHHDQHNAHHANAGQKPASHGSGETTHGANTTDHKKREKHMNCMPKIGDHKKREKHVKKKGKEGNCKDGNSSSSDSDSDHDAR